MGKIKKIILLLLCAVCVLIALYFAARGVASFNRHYSWQEMDWNQDGSTSILEFFEASDIGKRLVRKDSKECAEYYSLKDGLPVKIVCPK